MPIKQGLLPKWNVVIRDLKRGSLRVVYKDQGKEITRYVTLANSIIPDKYMAESNPNNPTEMDRITAWDTERLQWITFNISSLEDYNTAPGYGWEEGTDSGKEISTRETPRGSKERPRDRSTETDQGTQETQTDVGGAEGEGKSEPGEGKGSEGSGEEHQHPS